MPNGEEINEEIDVNPLSYEGLVQEEPERDVNLDEIDVTRSLTEAEEETEHTTDLRAAMKHLLPKFKSPRMNALLQPIMVSRVFPDNLLDLNYLLNMNEFEEHEDDADFDFVGVVTGNQAGTSIGFKGQGRIDILEIAGVAHEEEMDKLAKELGMGG